VAFILDDLAFHDDAITILKQVLPIREKHLGSEHSHVATVLNNLAQLLKATNRMDEAEPLMKRALKIDEKSFGQNHPKVAIKIPTA